MDAKQKLILNRLYSEFKLATGCTDPAAIATAVAQASEYLGADEKESLKLIEVSLSANIYKNAYGVDIPGSSSNGIEMAAALGYVIGQSKWGFEIFTQVSEQMIDKAQQLLREEKVVINILQDAQYLKMTVIITTQNDNCVELVVEPEYLQVESVCRNGDTVFKSESELNNRMIKNGVTLRDLVDFITEIPLDQLDFIVKGIEVNKRFVEEGIKSPRGIKIGDYLSKYANTAGLTSDIGTKIKMITACGVDARMGGLTLPVMSSAGSGNLGIGATIPLIEVCEHYSFPNEKLIRATALSNLIHIYIKELTGKLTSACGGVLVAMGTASAIVWLFEGSYEQIEGAIKNIAANLTGMVCDGANYGCAFKVSTSAVEAYYAATLALQGCIATNMGIVDESINKTIENVANIYLGMNPLDSVVLNMMKK